MNNITFVNTHLENWRADWDLRKKQLLFILSKIKLKGPIVLAGDFNPNEGIVRTIFGQKVYKEISLLRSFLKSQGLFDPFMDTDYTFFDYFTKSKMDWFCFTKNIKILNKKNNKTTLSDHNCLSVEIE